MCFVINKCKGKHPSYIYSATKINNKILTIADTKLENKELELEDICNTMPNFKELESYQTDCSLTHPENIDWVYPLCQVLEYVI